MTGTYANDFENVYQLIHNAAWNINEHEILRLILPAGVCTRELIATLYLAQRDCRNDGIQVSRELELLFRKAKTLYSGQYSRRLCLKLMRLCQEILHGSLVLVR